MSQNKFPSVNQLTRPLTEALINNAASLCLGVKKLKNGATIIDAGIEARGGLEAGRRIAEICLGGLGSVQLRAASSTDKWPWHIDVQSNQPLLACLGSQYAGWSLSYGEGKQAFFALGSGPGRALGSKESLFDEIGYRDRASHGCLVLEVDKEPPIELIDSIAEQCKISAAELCLILTPTSSLSGVVQIVSRVLETALHKAHELKFPLQSLVDGMGSAPLCPPAPDFLTAMSRTNDAILFAGQVQLFVDCDDDSAEQLAQGLPSSASRDYGKPFGEIFKAANYDFYRIDPMLFSPAKVIVSSLKTGHSFHAGRINYDLLDHSFSTSF